MNLQVPTVDRYLGHQRQIRAVAFHDGEALEATLRRLAPVAALGCFFQHMAIAWLARQQAVTELVGILAGRLGQFVHEALDHEAVRGVADGAVVAHVDADFLLEVIHMHVRDVVGVIRRGLDSERVHRLLEDAREHACSDGGCRDVHVEGDELTFLIQTARDFVVEGGPVSVVGHVVFAGPDDLHGTTDGLGAFDRSGDEVHFEAPTEATTEVGGVHFHLSGLEAGGLGGHQLRKDLVLRGSVEVAAVRLDVRRTVLRFQRGMGQQREMVGGAQDLGGLGERRRGIAVLAGGAASRGSRCLQRGAYLGRVQLGIRARVPSDLESGTRFARLPVVVGDDRDTAAGRQYLVDARQLFGSTGVERDQLAANGGRLFDAGVEHAGQLHVDTVDGGAVDLDAGVEPLVRLANDLEGARGLQRHLLRHGQLGGGFGEFAVGEAMATAVINGAAGGVQRGGRQGPMVGGGLYEHGARLRTGAAELFPSIADAGAAAGELAAQ